jgi:hypothetical protein
MSIFNSVEPETANVEAKAAFDLVRAAFGEVPNLMKMLAIAPNVLKGIMVLNQEVTNGELESSLVEQIALLTSGINPKQSLILQKQSSRIEEKSMPQKLRYSELMDLVTKRSLKLLE